MWLLFWVGFLLMGIFVLLPLYARLLRDVEKYNYDEFIEMRRPQLFMLSPARGIRLQYFIYSGSKKKGIHSSVAKRCRVLAILTPTFVILVFVTLFLAVRMEMHNL
jgi:hypothetical protein